MNQIDKLMNPRLQPPTEPIEPQPAGGEDRYRVTVRLWREGTTHVLADACSWGAAMMLQQAHGKKRTHIECVTKP